MPINYGSNNVATSGNLVASSGNFTSALTVNGAPVATGVSVSITNATDNRVLTSTNTGGGINAETNATFDGTTLAVSGAISVDNLMLDGNTLSSTNSNGNIIIQPSGTGALQRDSGGNARGNYAIDWQRSRTNNTQVASGSNSVIGGGYHNTASAAGCTVGGGVGNTSSSARSTVGGGHANTSSNFYSTVGGGYGNTSSGAYSTIGGGGNNTSSSNYSTVAGGSNNIVNGSRSSTIGGGEYNRSSAPYSTIPGGFQAVASRFGELSHAAGRFLSPGDAQHSIFVLRGKTTNASQTTTLGLDGTTTGRLTIGSGSILSGTINIVGTISTGASVARYLRQFTIKNVGGTTSLVGSIITLGTDEDASTTISITADDTNDALSISVTRAANETWRWVAVVDVVSVTYGT